MSTLFQSVKIPTFFGTLYLLDTMDISAQIFVQSATVWKDYATTIPSIDAIQTFLLSIYRSPYAYSTVMPLLIEELKVHITTRIKITENASIESIRTLFDFIVKDASSVATSLTLDINDIITIVENSIGKITTDINSVKTATSLADGAIGVVNTVETVAETVGTFAKESDQIVTLVDNVAGDVRDVVNSAGLGGTAVSSAVDAVQTGAKVVSDVVEKTEEIAEKVEVIAEKVEVIVRSNAHILQQLQRYLCCCCKKSGSA
jgi:methyl-accepting chemotaxis protein